LVEASVGESRLELDQPQPGMIGGLLVQHIILAWCQWWRVPDFAASRLSDLQVRPRGDGLLLLGVIYVIPSLPCSSSMPLYSARRSSTRQRRRGVTVCSIA
jgi:hypothetical protein